MDLYKDGLALQRVLHGVDADVVQLPRKEVAQSHRRRRVGEVQLRAFTFDRGRVDDAIACVCKEQAEVAVSRTSCDHLRLKMSI